VATVLLVLLLAATGRADDQNEAKRHFDEGTKAFNLGEFGRAVTEYRAAYNAKPDPVFLYNIAQAYRLNNDLSQALFFYRSYLRNLPHAPNRREVSDRVEALEHQLAAQKALAMAPPNSVQPSSVASAPSPSSAPAPEPEAAPAPAPATTTTTTSEPPPATSTAKAPATENAGADLTAHAAAKPDKTPLYKKWWLWTGVGVVAVGVGLGVGLGVGIHHGAPASQGGTLGVF
jgi:hypothetical protein